MLVSKQNIVRIEVEVGCFNPFYEACKKHNETRSGAHNVIDALEWEFNKEGQAAEFEKIKEKGFEFRCFNTSTFGIQYFVEYVTKTSYYD